MTDYAKLKVTELKAELKQRGIPQTGLRLKQDFIDRLKEEDAKADSSATNGESTPAQEAHQETEEPAQKEQPTEQPPPVAAPQPEDSAEAERELQDNGKPDEASVKEQSEQGSQEPLVKSPVREPEPEAPQPEPIPDTNASAPPAELAPGDTAEQQHSPMEKDIKPAEPTIDNAPIPSASGENTGLSTPLPAEEVLEDQRKRKRRSQTPIPTPEAIASKKRKAQEDLPEDNGEMDVAGDAPEQTAAGTDEPKTVGTVDEPRDAAVPEDSAEKKGAPSKHDVRFKGLFASTESEPARHPSPPPDVDTEGQVEPALHAATTALYVEGLMRPLQPFALRSHLVSIACPPGQSPNPDIIVEFYLDPIKTHGFVVFNNASAASRARATLHNTVWPDERNRKPLFVDFIPEKKFQEWVDMESSRKGGGPPPRWEVKYEPTDDGVEAVLKEIDPRGGASARAPAPSDFSRPPPLGPRAEMGAKDRRPSGAPAPDHTSRPGQGFKPLDELFMSTTSKPKLYYLPVPRDVADRRLDRFDDLLRKGAFPRRGGDETRRISFEDGDLFVDNGAEYGRARGGGGRGRGGRGRGRGGFGDSWRDNRRNRY
ncbi:hypothetical protein FE257_005251 [Aspergillus nanangensis]|uniref:SAP domain-containing protein n=1 Tax=Aspergillus nanangensis TaxID=2582783 RepID=A0AAD4CQT8_ASPNN|nr:hypothetical protein FE257_005251 [Aspergillus nanangensis]